MCPLADELSFVEGVMALVSAINILGIVSAKVLPRLCVLHKWFHLFIKDSINSSNADNLV